MTRLEPLTREEVRAALRFDGPSRPAKAWSLWHGPEAIETHGESFSSLLREYPDDVVAVGMLIDYWQGPSDDPTYRFAFGTKCKDPALPIDAAPIIVDWSELDAFLAEFPDAHRPAATDRIALARQENPDKYILVGWGHYLHQRLAYLRGIENLLFDFHDHSAELRRVMDALLDFYAVWAVRAAEAGADGVWAGDDLGTQMSLFMSPECFRSLYKPYYRRLGEILHGAGLDFWMHTCGCVRQIIPDLIEIGLDALHPIQAGTMDEVEVVSEFSGQIAFWLGMDVQQLIPFGTPEEIRRGVMARAELFHRPEGGLIIAAGNALVPSIPIENIRAYADALDEWCAAKLVR